MHCTWFRMSFDKKIPMNMGFIVNGYGGVDVFLILVNELL